MSALDIEVAKVVTTGGTQSRVQLSEQAVADYAEAMKNGEALPPIVVFHDGSTYWLADGFHRVMAATRAGETWLAADVRKGTKRDAILHSVGANAAHGLPRTNADKRRAVEMLLSDEEWSQWSNREIARHCAVNPSLVDTMRKELSAVQRQMPDRKVERNGSVYTQHTENIGKRGQPGAKEAKTKAIRELANQGYRATQIAAEIGLSEPTVRLYANQAGISLPAAKTKKIDNRRVIEQTVLGMEAAAQSLNTIPVSFDGIDPNEAAEWAEAVADAMRIFRRFHKQLSEAANG